MKTNGMCFFFIMDGKGEKKRGRKVGGQFEYRGRREEIHTNALFFSSLEASCFEIGLFCSDIGCIQRG